MKYAIVNGERSEARRGLAGECPACSSEMIAKCGEIYAHHWAHKGRRNCDAWWENETEWHRAWKNLFPTDWQEIVHRADDGEKHIADVQTEDGWTIEFQHSLIKPEERVSREEFYEKMIWVVDGKLRPTYGRAVREVLRVRVLADPQRSCICSAEPDHRTTPKAVGRQKCPRTTRLRRESTTLVADTETGYAGAMDHSSKQGTICSGVGPDGTTWRVGLRWFADRSIELIREFEAMEQRARTMRTRAYYPPARRSYRRGRGPRGPGWRL